MGGIDSPVLGWIGGGENASASPLVSKKAPGSLKISHVTR